MDKFIVNRQDSKSKDDKSIEQLIIDQLIFDHNIKLRSITGQNLQLRYGIVMSRSLANMIFDYFESNIDYMPIESTKMHIFGRYVTMPSRQVAYGDTGLTYSFSGLTVPARPWTPILEHIRSFVSRLSDGIEYNFVLINRYNDGNDYIGEHRDIERELDSNAPIASLSIGATRTFQLRHIDSRKRKHKTNNLKPIDNGTMRLELESGSLLLMMPPTNHYWYHSLPIAKRIINARINLTFRRLIIN